jgi:ubiquinone/menaquinone biosynthesis C-methylase UbiE
VCTLSLCAIPDHARAIAEMARVLRSGGKLLLLDHMAAVKSS